ncbi:uncharacterized protein TNCV_2023641 [Trichonephila clavipes]|nr:uncharacterized protein TNCV_2023641 [Trichonephila clavipes]
MNSGSVFDIKIVASVFGEIMVSAHWQRAFVISIYWPITWRDCKGCYCYTYRLPLVRSDVTLNSARYICGVLRPMALPFIRAMRNPTLEQDNARPHIADTENVRLLPWPARSTDLSSIENIWFMVSNRLARHHTPVIAVVELWHRC